MDKMRHASWSGKPVVTMALCNALRVRVLLDTITCQDIRGGSRGVPDRGRRRRRPGENAHRGGGRGLGAVQRLRVGSVSTKVLRASRGPVLIVHRDRRETKGGTGPAAGSEIRRGSLLRAWTPVRRRLGAAGRLTQDRQAIQAPHDACRTLRFQDRLGTRAWPIALHNTHRPDP
jgi:hypothetical protein